VSLSSVFRVISAKLFKLTLLLDSHPLGATGGRLLTSLITELQRTGKDIGVATLCMGTGAGKATLIGTLMHSSLPAWHTLIELCSSLYSSRVIWVEQDRGVGELSAGFAHFSFSII